MSSTARSPTAPRRTRVALLIRRRTAPFYEATQTYGLPVVFANNAEGTEDVAKLAPEAGYLLIAAFPSLTLAQTDAILTQTEGPGGGFLDNGSAFGVYSRLDLLQGGRASRGAFCKGEIRRQGIA
jgi:hypothetical protein